MYRHGHRVQYPTAEQIRHEAGIFYILKSTLLLSIIKKELTIDSNLCQNERYEWGRRELCCGRPPHGDLSEHPKAKKKSKAHLNHLQRNSLPRRSENT